MRLLRASCHPQLATQAAAVCCLLYEVPVCHPQREGLGSPEAVAGRSCLHELRNTVRAETQRRPLLLAGLSAEGISAARWGALDARRRWEGTAPISTPRPSSDTLRARWARPGPDNRSGPVHWPWRLQ